jgi:hypothetical protein
VRSRRSTAHGTIEMARGQPVSERGSICAPPLSRTRKRCQRQNSTNFACVAFLLLLTVTAQVAWPVNTVAAANAAIALMRQEGVAGSADHNMTAYRIVVSSGPKKGGGKGAGKIEKAYDDDGEANLGQRLLGCLTKQGACNVAVMVSRVYGGENIGKKRFEMVCERATTLLKAVGHEPGVGIRHDWGDGNVLGGDAGPSSSSSSAVSAASSSSLGNSGSTSGGGSSSSSGKKRQRGGANSAAEEEAHRRATQREMMARAAEQRTKALGL